MVDGGGRRMSSLYDKLRAMKPFAAPPREQPLQADCLIKRRAFPCADFPLRPISRDIMRVMDGVLPEKAIQPEDIVFFDTETTGLSGGVGTLAFVAGIGSFSGGEFVVTQYMIRDYHEEASLLRHVLEALQSCSLLVTFNGKSFDMPLIESRLVMNRLNNSFVAPSHLDLLHLARRVYKLRLQRCSLAALETEVFGMQREDDLPGAQVPERFFRYLKTREEALLDDVLRHNEQDILSMARLLFALILLHEKPLTAAFQEELYSLGRIFERRGEVGRARQCYRAVGGGRLGELAAVHIAESYRREKDHERAADAFEALRLSGRGGAQVYISLAKIYEHRFRQLDKALDIARRGMVYCLENLSGNASAYEDLKRRYNRLIIRTGGK
ncbi:MAG: ribonuclease H-like domain-containing protein [Clostridiales bacterium]|nr:ribonuclease H-like domain-containing protein [Clostridiales bacterium]